MKNSFTNLIKLTLASLFLFLTGFIAPLYFLKDAPNHIMQITFGAEILASVAITITYFSVKSYKQTERVKERNHSYKHSKRVEKSVDYYEVANSISESGNKVIKLFNAA